MHLLEDIIQAPILFQVFIFVLQISIAMLEIENVRIFRFEVFSEKSIFFNKKKRFFYVFRILPIFRSI